MKTIFIILSIPFAVIGFIWSFIRQAFEDGMTAEEAVREYCSDINIKEEVKKQ